MELRDYLTALRRYWGTWVAITLAGVLVALAVVVFTPPTYQATAQVFVTGSGTGTSSSAQFVSQRVVSYPDIARSRTVLLPVIGQLGLQESFPSLQSRVTATNPTGTSQINIAVSGRDPAQAADVANAIALRFGTTVEALEGASRPSPVQLTVTNPAAVPTTPVSPVPRLLLPLGFVAGIALGAAAAVIRSRVDTRVYDEADIGDAWHGRAVDLDRIPVIAPARGRRARRRTLMPRTAAALARRLELISESKPVRVLLVPAAPGREDHLHRFLSEVRAQLSHQSPGAAVERAASENRVRLEIGAASASLRDWRRITTEYDGVVMIITRGHVDRGDVEELSTTMSLAGIAPIAVVLTTARRRRWLRRAEAAPSTGGQESLNAPARPLEGSAKR